MYKGYKKLSPPALAVGPNTAFLRGTPNGLVKGYRVSFTGTGISTGAAFNTVNPTGATKKARGVDDLDKFLAACFNNFEFSVDGTLKNFAAMDPTRLRTHLSVLNRKDFKVTGLLVDGAQVPISSGAAAALGFSMRIPVALARKFLPDGDAFAQGSDRLANGGYFATNVVQVAGPVVLGGGTMTLAALSWTITPIIDAQGAKTDVGADYELVDDKGQVSDNPPLKSAMRAYVLEDDATSAATWTSDSPAHLEQTDSGTINDGFNDEWNPDGTEENSAARCVPLLCITRGLQFHELDSTPRSPKIKNDLGATQRFLQCYLYPRNPAAVRKVAAVDGNTASGASTTVPAVPSTHTGAIPARLAGFNRVTVLPGSVAIPGSTQHASIHTVK